MSYRPKVVKGKVKNTETSLDGCTLFFGLWAYDNYESYHLYDWDDSVDKQVMEAMYDTDEFYRDAYTLEEFERDWKNGEWEPSGVFCIDLDQLDVIEVIQNEVKEAE